MTNDNTEMERQVLTQKINELDWMDHELRSYSRSHEESVLDFQGQFQQMSHQIEFLLSSSEMDISTQQELQENQELTWHMNRYIEDHLEEVTTYSRKVRSQLDNEREGLLAERNRLPWE